MSTSDAPDSELRVGGELTTPLHGTAGRTRATRKQQDETFGGRFKEENHHGDETKTERHSQQSAIRREKTHTALIFGADRPREEEEEEEEEEEVPGCGEPTVQTRRLVGTRFTSFLSFRLSKKTRSAEPELKPKRKPHPCPHRGESEEKSSQVNGRTSPPDTSAEAANDLPLSEKKSFPVKKEEKAVTLIYNGLETTPNSSRTHSFSNGELGPGSRPRTTCFGSAESEEDIKDFTRPENRNHLVELSDPTAPMLSSTMVSVLAPHWNGRPRWIKRGVATSDLEAQGNLQEVTYGPNIEANSAHEQFLETQSQHGGKRGLRDGSQAQLRAPFLGTRRNTEGWSTKSGPSSLNLDYESKRKVVQSISLDVSSGRLDNRKIHAGAFSPVATTAFPMSPLSLDLNAHRRMAQASNQGELSPSSSKPTTSNLLLSLRRLNSNCRNSNLTPVLPETKPLSRTSATSDRAAQLFMPRLSPTLLNNNDKEQASCRTTETGPILSPSSPNYRGGDVYKTPPFSASPRSKDSEDSTFSQPSQTTRTLSCPKQTFLTRGQPVVQHNCHSSDKRADYVSESSLSSPRLSPYGHHTFLKSQPLPRRTTLTSTSCWKQVTQEDSYPLSLTDTVNINNKNKMSTPLVTPCNNNCDLGSPSPTDNKRFSSQILNNRDNNNTPQSVFKGNLNILFMTQGGADTLRRSNAEDTPDQELHKQQYGSNLNSREPQKPHSLSSVSSSSKFSSSAGQTTLSHRVDCSKPDVCNTSFKANVRQLPLNLLNPKSPNTPTESTSNYKTKHYTPQANNSPTSPHSFRDSGEFYSLLLDSSKSMDHDTKSHLTLPSSLSTIQSTSEKNDLTVNTQPSPALFTPTSTSSPTATNVTLSKTTSCADRAEGKSSVTFTRQLLSLDALNTCNSQALSPNISSPLLSPSITTSSSSNTQLVSSQTSIPAVSPTRSTPYPPSAKFTMTATTTPQLLDFQRTYSSTPKSFHPKTVSALIPTYHVTLSPKTNYSPVSTCSTTPTTSSTTLSSLFAPTTTTSPSLLTPPSTPALTSLTSSTTTVNSYSFLTPPATPTLSASPETTLPQVERTFSDNLELSRKKQLPRVEGRKARRVTWQDSMDLQHSEATTVQKSEPHQALMNPLSPSRATRSVGAPSIFSFLRLSSPTGTSSPLCPPTSKTSSIQVWRGGKHQQSLSSGPADQICRERGRAQTGAIGSPSQFSFDHRGRELTTSRPESRLSEEASAVRHHSSAPLSIPPNFSSGDKLHYSSTPKNIAPTSPLFQQSSSPSIYTVPSSLHPDPVANMTSPNSKLPLSPINSPQPLSPSFLNRTGLQENSKFVVAETDQVNNNHCKHSSQDGQNGHVSLVDNSACISPRPLPLQADKALSSPSMCISVIETVVYSISTADSTAALDNATSKPLMQHTSNTQVSAETKFSRQSHTKSVVGKSKFISFESKKEIPPFQSPKKGLFALKKSVSTPNSTSSANHETPFSPDKAKPETERASKTSNKMDQVLSRLRQRFSSRRSDDELLFSWRWKRSSQTPSVSGSSDISDISDINVESNKPLEEERKRERGEAGRNSDTGIDERDRWTENRYTLIPSSAVGNRMARDQFSVIDSEQSKHSVFEVLQKDKDAFAKEEVSESKIQAHLTSPTKHHFDFYNDDRADYKPTSQSLSCRDPSPARQQTWSPNCSATFPTQYRKSTSSPRSPFSPFSSLSPISPFAPADVTDDVFYSPKLQRRKESTSPCEQGEGISLVGPRRSQTSTGPSSGGQDKEDQASYSSCADLKYGIEAGKSVSVSSVLSCRPSGPGRISTGSRFMSVSNSNLSEPALTFGVRSSSSNGRSLDRWSVTSDQTSKYDYRATNDSRVSSVPSNQGKMRSRSLPRSLTRSLANWSSEAAAPPPLTTTTTRPGRLWSPNLDTYHSVWDAQGPPSPPPSPAWSPASRRMSKPPRGYISSLSAFEESSDGSSDTTTDDEYYLEAGEGKEKETEL